MSYWYFPSNKDIFDMVRCLNERDEVDQPCTAALKVGDTIFIYVTAPYGQIMYQMEVTEIFKSFEEVNKGRWAKYAGRNLAPRKGPWFRMKFVDHANPGHPPLQPSGLLQNIDMKTAALIYRLNKERVAYILEEIKASKE